MATAAPAVVNAAANAAAKAAPPIKSIAQTLGGSGITYMICAVLGIIAKIAELAIPDPPEVLGPALTVLPICMLIFGAISIYGMLTGNEMKAVMAMGLGFGIVFFFEKLVEYTQRNKLKKEVKVIEKELTDTVTDDE